jgi:hypothetical protein
MIAVAAPTAVTFLSRMRSSIIQVNRVAAGQSSVLANARTLGSPVPNPLPPLNPNQPNHSNPPPSSTSTELCGRRPMRP